eukprot:gnl/Spiro4/5101_TR2549_c0_g1_i1.p1 gnl/Spiro4/5101_TR2549_c0_g1~~gnl/Spiro4/5101_TR2549_c0_g1_i1.p1  ORF type:complete len:262 (-),score=39.79 gnl/Spiro4/5101_TR2549_c0_g1_i1:85-870(-)
MAKRAEAPIPLQPIASDIRNLLKAVRRSNALSFSEYKVVWQQLKFSCIFQSYRPEDPDYAFFFRAMYICVLTYLEDSRAPLPVQLGVVYSLYCLYATQPPRVRVRVPIAYSQLEALVSLERDLLCNSSYIELAQMRSGGPLDACIILRRMRGLSAFTYHALPMYLKFEEDNVSAMIRQPLGSAPPPDLRPVTSLRNTVELDEIDRVCSEYRVALSSLMVGEAAPPATSVADVLRQIFADYDLGRVDSEQHTDPSGGDIAIE